LREACFFELLLPLPTDEEHSETQAEEAALRLGILGAGEQGAALRAEARRGRWGVRRAPLRAEAKDGELESSSSSRRAVHRVGEELRRSPG